MSNYNQGQQRTVTRNVVKFMVGDLVGSRLRGETLSGVVVEVPSMDYIKIRVSPAHGQAGDFTYDSDYFYIIKGADETSDEMFQRNTIRHEELTRSEVTA